MRLLFLFTLVIFNFRVCLAQDQLLTGTTWSYQFELHSGNGGGATEIELLGDSIIQNVTYKKLLRTWFWETNFPPLERREGREDFGLLRFSGDSLIYRNWDREQVIWDTGLQKGDSLIVQGVEGTEQNLLLVIDSIETIKVASDSLKKWYGQKFCQSDDGYFFIDEFVYLEKVGPLDDYLIWNAEGCILGFGSHSFVCMEQFEFKFPENTACERLLLNTLKFFLDGEQVKIYPNPMTDWVYASIGEFRIDRIVVMDLFGRQVASDSFNDSLVQFSVGNLNPGVYLILVTANGRIYSSKLIKN